MRWLKSDGSVAAGMYLGFGLHLVWLSLFFSPLLLPSRQPAEPAVTALMAMRWLQIVPSIGLLQLVYLVPVMLILAALKQRLTLKGVCIIGIATTAWNIGFLLLAATPRPESYAGF